MAQIEQSYNTIGMKALRQLKLSNRCLPDKRQSRQIESLEDYIKDQEK